MTKKTAICLLVLTALLWSTSGVLIKSINWNPVAIASCRGLISGLTIFLCVRSRNGSFNLRELTWIHGLSGFSLAMLSFTFIAAMKLTTAANTIVLQYTAPIWVALFAPIFLKEKTKVFDWIFMFIIFGGMFLFFQDGLASDGFWGNILATISGFFFATQAMCLRFLKHRSPSSAMIVGNFFTFILGISFWSFPLPDFKGILCLLALGIFQLGISYYLYSLASAYVNSLELVMITMLEPILSPLLVFLVLQEKPSFLALIGGFIVIAGVSMWSVLKVKANEKRLLELD
ncbi:MAG: DMT family transporter [Deltaproteobacteria bacterium]|jgi:drug/metabolite transporter (DMT)-like permease|nr:DMT family transporter [Deltaproteobacteria bacterium]